MVLKKDTKAPVATQRNSNRPRLGRDAAGSAASEKGRNNPRQPTSSPCAPNRGRSTPAFWAVFPDASATPHSSVQIIKHPGAAPSARSGRNTLSLPGPLRGFRRFRPGPGAPAVSYARRPGRVRPACAGSPATAKPVVVHDLGGLPFAGLQRQDIFSVLRGLPPMSPAGRAGNSVPVGAQFNPLRRGDRNLYHPCRTLRALICVLPYRPAPAGTGSDPCFPPWRQGFLFPGRGEQAAGSFSLTPPPVRRPSLVRRPAPVSPVQRDVARRRRGVGSGTPPPGGFLLTPATAAVAAYAVACATSEGHVHRVSLAGGVPAPWARTLAL